MKRAFLLLLIFNVPNEAALAGESPFNYINIYFGIGNYKSPLIYTYSLEYSRDINLSKKSSFLIGAEWENFYQHEKYEVDTNFVGGVNINGPVTIRYYSHTEKIMFMNLAIAYKYYISKNKNNSIYVQTEINLNYMVRQLSKGEYLYRDSSQTLFPGPYSYSDIKHEGNNIWLPDNIRPAFSIGYLKNINKRLAYNFKFDLIVAIPYQTPSDLAILYPKLCIGLAFH